MQLTWLVLASVLLVGVSYVAVRRARRPRVVDWTFLGASLFALATRDLFRTREQARPAHARRESAAESATRRPSRDDDDPQRTPLFARLRRRVAGWLN
ncbi:hypothetical protein M0R88_12745 [Halorussus gelatinilyticus]|uniref:Uncharacterized protein n=1 Tax=Halorussus gelatinilyticus TaxID=2937524 RepID=A0A8U0IFB1_9EURY|nr:hypothetical protein [Halorussus gelatinilyticus]UPV99390.1 hypothetical protein M0R88_12745 [Halorussus gelatinilyticus]